MKILPVVAEFTHVDGQTHRHDEADRCLLRLHAHAPKILTLSEVRIKQTKQGFKKNVPLRDCKCALHKCCFSPRLSHKETNRISKKQNLPHLYLKGNFRRGVTNSLQNSANKSNG